MLGLGLGLGLSRGLRNRPPSPILPGGFTLDFDFERGQALAPGFSGLTIARASPGYAPRKDGSYASFGPNEFRRTALGLLVEETRTNVLRNNSMQGADTGSPGGIPTNWLAHTSGADGLTRTVVGVGVEDGIEYIDIRYQGVTTATITGRTVAAPEANNVLAAASGQVWTASYFLRLVDGSLSGLTQLEIRVRENDNAGVLVAQGASASLIPAALSGKLSAQRFIMTRTLSGGATVAFISTFIAMGYNTGTPIDFTLRIGWPQLELGGFATSPIRTVGAAAARNADLITLSMGTYFNPLAGTIFAEGTVLHDSAGTNGVLVSLDDTTASERIQVRRSSTLNAGFVIVDGGVAQASIGPANGSWLSGARHRLAAAYAANDFALSDNGAAVVIDTAGTLPSPTRLTIGYGVGGNAFGGWIHRIGYAPSRRPNAELQALAA